VLKPDHRPDGLPGAPLERPVRAERGADTRESLEQSRAARRLVDPRQSPLLDDAPDHWLGAVRAALRGVVRDGGERRLRTPGAALHPLLHRPDARMAVLELVEV